MKNLLTCLFLLGCSMCLTAQNWELRYLQALEGRRTDVKNDFYTVLTKTAPPLCVAAPASMFATSLVTGNKRLRQMSITGGIGLAVTVAESYALKALIGKKRPYEKYPDLLTPLVRKTSPSFPSGHTSTAFYTATWLTLENPKWYVAAPSFLWAGLVAHSRNYTGVHYLTDVLVGAALGSATGYLVWRLRKP
jgi:membrane-associated phospholipid phosphatase